MRALLVQGCEREGLCAYADLLEARGFACETVHPYRGDAFPPAGAHDAVLVGGTPLSVRELERHPSLRRTADLVTAVLEAGVPLLGVCGGAQLLARQLGAAVRRSPVVEIGTYVVGLTEEGVQDSVLAGFPRRFPVFHWHDDAFDLPAGASLLVEGEGCRNQMFRRGRAVGVQFHLEVSAAEAGAWADAYADELAAFGKTREQLVAETAAREPRMRALAGQLVDGFLSLV